MCYNQNLPCMMCFQAQMMMNMHDVMTDMEEDTDLERLYPKIYFKIKPLINYHCNEMEQKYGAMYCPTNTELKKITEDIYDKLSKDLDDEDQDETDRSWNRNDKEGLGGRPIRRRPFLNDLISILLLSDLSKRRRRRRRRPHPGGY